MSPSFRIVLRTGPTPGKTFPLEKGEIFIGRDLSNDIIINDPEISRRHSRMFYQNGSYILEDLGSTNGTSVNGQRLVSPYILHPGETITLGERISLSFEASPQEGDATVSGGQKPVGAAKPVIAPPPNQPIIAYPPAYTPTSYDQAAPPPTHPLNQPEGGYPSQHFQSTAAPAYQPPEPISQPAYQATPSQPSSYDSPQSPFAQQVPIAPGYDLDEPRTKLPVWPFIIIGILLLIILVLVIDDFRLWCPLFGMCG